MKFQMKQSKQASIWDLGGIFAELLVALADHSSTSS